MKYKHLNKVLGSVQTDLGDRPATLAGIRGFLFGIACSPEIVHPSEWLDAMVEFELIDLHRSADPAPVVDDLIRLYNEVNDARLRAERRMPDGVRFRSDIMSNFGKGATVGQWSFGFILAHNYLQDVWTEHTPDYAEEFLNETLAILMHFSAADAAAESLDVSPEDPAFVTVSEALRDDFPEAIAVFAKLSAAISQSVSSPSHDS